MHTAQEYKECRALSRRQGCYCYVPDSLLYCYCFACAAGDENDLISSVPETTTTKHSGTSYSRGRQQLVLGPALNVTVRQGDEALMPCVAPHLGDRTVIHSLLFEFINKLLFV